MYVCLVVWIIMWVYSLRFVDCIATVASVCNNAYVIIHFGASAPLDKSSSHMPTCMQSYSMELTLN